MVQRLPSCGLILPIHGNRIALIGPIPHAEFSDTTLAQVATRFSDSVLRSAPLRTEGLIAYAGLLVSPSAPAEALLAAIRSQTALPCTPPEELAVLRLPAYIAHVTVPVDAEYTHRVCAGPFETYAAAAAWRQAILAADDTHGVREEEAWPFHLPVQFLDDLPLSRTAHGVLAQLLGLGAPRMHPYACLTCYPNARGTTSDECDAGPVLAILIDGSISNDEFRLVGPFEDVRRCEKWCRMFMRLTKAHGGSTHALPMHTEPVAADFDWLDDWDFAETGRFPGMDAESVEARARELYDPSATTVIFVEWEGKADEGRFAFFGPVREENQQEYIEMLPGAAWIKDSNPVREILSPDRIFELVRV